LLKDRLEAATDQQEIHLLVMALSKIFGDYKSFLRTIPDPSKKLSSAADYDFTY
jgi:hypothetical protein